VEFEILGPLHVRDGERDVEIGGVRQRTVLALLILRANEVVRTERLIDEVWGESPPRNAAAALHSHVSRLRKALGPDVLARREWGYVLRTPHETIDLHRFELLLAEAEPKPASERARTLREALSLWRGPALADLSGEPALQRDSARLDELHLTTLERRIDADLEAGRSLELAGELEALITEHPLREHLRWQLILSLYRAGRQAEALEVYRETRRVLAEELGLDPSPELRDLERAILLQDPTLAPRSTTHQPGAADQRQTGRRLWTIGILGLAAIAILGTGALAAVALVRSDRPARGSTGGTLVVITRTESGPVNTPTKPSVGERSQTTEPPSTEHTTVQTTTLAPPPDTSTTPQPHSPGTTSSVASSTPPTTEATHGQTTPKTSTNSPTAPVTRIVTITDSFESDYVDPTIWHQIKSDDNVSIVEAGGYLVLTVGAAAQPTGQYNSIAVHVGTQCNFPADFDARVDFSLLEWPAADNVFVGLNAFFADSAVGRQFHPQWADGYTGWVAPNSGSVPMPDTSGSLRIARTKGVETTYFWHRGAWQKIAVGTSRGAAVFGLQATWFPNGGNPPFGKQEVKVAFDNFRVIGNNPICPPGSQSPGG